MLQFLCLPNGKNSKFKSRDSAPCNYWTWLCFAAQPHRVTICGCLLPTTTKANHTLWTKLLARLTFFVFVFFRVSRNESLQQSTVAAVFLGFQNWTDSSIGRFRAKCWDAESSDLSLRLTLPGRQMWLLQAAASLLRTVNRLEVRRVRGCHEKVRFRIQTSCMVLSVPSTEKTRLKSSA